MQLQSYYLDALDHVLGWNLPDEACPQAVTAQAGHLAGLDSDELSRGAPD